MDESRPIQLQKREIVEVSKKWKKVQTMIQDIIQYGIDNEIIAKRDDTVEGGQGFRLASSKKTAEADVDQNDKRHGDIRVNLPTNDITPMHSAIPFLPLWAAIFCAIINVIIPGSGTIISGFFALCLGQTRVNYRTGQKLMTVLINSLVGISQFFTITFLFVGWFWSIAWSGLLIIYSVQYRDALRRRRQEMIATAALEALTRNSILHRRDVKTLVKKHKEKSGTKKYEEQTA